jgi:lauroyl/myristoyl acyltransferase
MRIIHRGELSEREVRRRSRRVVMNFARAIQLFLEMPFLEWEDMRARCDMSEFDAAVEALGPDRPFIIASGHIGPWELGGYYLSHKGFVVNTVALEHPSREVTGFYSERRSLLGIHAYPMDGAFHLLKAGLDRGECVALLIDRAYGKVSKRFTLFGQEREFPLGHLVLALRCNVPVLTGALLFDGKERFRYVHGGTHWPDNSEGEFERLEELQDRCLRDLERIIREHSDQWCHFRPLNRTETYDA